MRLALKIDVDTLRGTRAGVPALVALLRKHGVTATFLFSLGPDHTGRAIKRVFRPGFVGKVRRTSVVRHYGVKTLLYGTLLPGPDIGLRCADILRGVRDTGYETGVHCWDHVEWQDKVAHAESPWVEREMRRARERYEEILGAAPLAHGAAGWQMNPHALRLTQRLGYAWSSDCRGTHPFIPVWNAEVVFCPQIPTTLPTLDEIIGLDGVDEQNAHEALLARTAAARSDQVFTLHAELEGMKLAPVFERLLEGWTRQGYRMVPLRDLWEKLDLAKLPRHEMVMGTVPGRSGTLLLQGEEFLTSWRSAA